MVRQIIKKYIGQSIEDDEVEIIIYGMEILGTSIFTAIFVIFLGIIMGQVISAITYLSVLILLRRNTGGYHSNTYIGCLLITSLNFLVIIFMGRFFKDNIKEVLGIIFNIYSTIKIYKTKPYVHKNRIADKEILEKSNIKKNKALSIIVLIAIMVYIFFLMGLIKGRNYFFDISISLIIVALSIGKRKEDESYEQSYN